MFKRPLRMTVLCLALALLMGFPVTSALAAKKSSDLEFQRFHGTAQKLSELGGKVTLVNFWASWCTPCLAELPSIIHLWNDYKDKGFNVVAVSIDDEPETAIPKIIKKLSLPFPVYTDPGQKLQAELKVSAVPTTVLMNEKGKILYTKAGEARWDSPEFRKKLDAWLKSAK